MKEKMIKNGVIAIAILLAYAAVSTYLVDYSSLSKLCHLNTDYYDQMYRWLTILEMASATSLVILAVYTIKQAFDDIIKGAE